jgi:hypothetical protein
MISVAPALGNAVQQAVGAELTHMPIRFEEVWRAIRAHEPVDNWITKSPFGTCRSAPVLTGRGPGKGRRSFGFGREPIFVDGAEHLS